MAGFRVRIATLAIAEAILVAACTAQIGGSGDPTASLLPADTALAAPSPSVGTSALASPSPDVSAHGCDAAPFFFTPPPYAAFEPVPGISVRATDKGHFKITNATSRTYYVGVFSWDTEDNLLCGRGVLAHDHPGGRVGAGKTIERLGGSPQEALTTVSIWAEPCGEGCYRDPIGQYVVPMSSVEPPLPGST
jgi:hypothetical protein